ncbi:hypothetical protein [Dactylosporangium sp. CA-092794]|uniref:hypothetical protein n=1 Tax=Dactylosporangium sp. CA-092794 TaxID=3239929 RepID=UPI003D8C1D60
MPSTRYPLRDVAIVEPDIEDVVARLYTGTPVTDAPCEQLPIDAVGLLMVDARS